MRQNINAYTITYTPKNAFRSRRVTEAFTAFSEARTRAMQILLDKCPRIYRVEEEQFIKDGVVHYRIYAYSCRNRYAITIKSLSAVNTNALYNDFETLAKREAEKKCAANEPEEAYTSVGGQTVRNMISAYENAKKTR